MAGVDKPLEPVRAAVGVMRGEQVDAVVAPSPIGRRTRRPAAARWRRRRGSTRCRGARWPPSKVPCGGEGADVALVEDRSGQRHPPPAAVAPGEGAVVDDLGTGRRCRRAERPSGGRAGRAAVEAENRSGARPGAGRRGIATSRPPTRLIGVRRSPRTTSTLSARGRPDPELGASARPGQHRDREAGEQFRQPAALAHRPVSPVSTSVHRPPGSVDGGVAPVVGRRPGGARRRPAPPRRRPTTSLGRRPVNGSGS